MLHAGAVEVTALHKHLLGADPDIVHLHVQGNTSSKRLAQSVRDALELTGTPMPPIPAVPFEPAGEEWSRVTELLGEAVGIRNGILRYLFARNEKLTKNGISLQPTMGFVTTLEFSMSEEGAEASTVVGTFALIAREVRPIMKELQSHGFTVSSVHHVASTVPDISFLHVWARGNVASLAAGVRAALERTRHKLRLPELEED